MPIRQELNGKLKIDKVQGEDWIHVLSLPENEWKSIPFESEIECSTQVKYANQVFVVNIFSVVVYDRVEKTWTIAYNQGISGLDVREVSVKCWIKDAWRPCTIKNSTHLLLEPGQSSFCITCAEVDEDVSELLFSVEFLGICKVAVEWHRPSIKDSRFLYNEVFIPLAAATGISVVSSLLFPKYIQDPKRAVGWAIPGWLLLDGVHVFQKVLNGAYTPKHVPFYKDKSFWIKAFASSVGPAVGMAMSRPV